MSGLPVIRPCLHRRVGAEEEIQLQRRGRALLPYPEHCTTAAAINNMQHDNPRQQKASLQLTS